MMAANREVAEATLALYSDCVRWLLLAAGGYECQEAEGTFMVAFAAAEAALEWCLMAQQVLRDMSWPARWEPPRGRGGREGWAAFVGGRGGEDTGHAWDAGWWMVCRSRTGRNAQPQHTAAHLW